MCTMSSWILVTGAAVSGLAIGFVPALVDRLRAPLQRELKSSAVDRLLDLFYVAWLPAMPLAGWLLDYGRSKELLFFGMLGCVLGIAWLGLVRDRRGLAGSALLLG